MPQCRIVFYCCIFFLCATLFTVGCTSSTDSVPNYQHSIRVNNQKIEKNTIIVELAETDSWNAWVTVYRNQDADTLTKHFESPLGTSHIGLGRTLNFPIVLDQPVNSGDTLWLILQEDIGTIGVFEQDIDRVLRYWGQFVATRFTIE